MNSYALEAVGFIRSTSEGPAAGSEGAPDAWLEIEPRFAEALLGMEVDHELIVITWLHEAKREVLPDIRAATKAVRSPACFTRASLHGRTRSACIL